jgi:hypothetical protein
MHATSLPKIHFLKSDVEKWPDIGAKSLTEKNDRRESTLEIRQELHKLIELRVNTIGDCLFNPVAKKPSRRYGMVIMENGEADIRNF